VGDATLTAVANYSIRVIGDPVLKQRASEIGDIDGRLVQLVDDMFDIMYDAPGIGLAAPQIGVQKRLFVYEFADEPGVLINPEIVESDGEWVYNEGCLSIPGIFFEIARPKTVLIKGIDLDGNDVQIEADELQARLYQHELDHLDGTLMVEHLTEDQSKAAKKHLLELRLDGPRKGKPVTLGTDGALISLD
jgi:peptide deformylase